MTLFAEILEIIMILCFGASWPFNVIKSYKARTTKGKSLTFLCLIFFGYIAGIVMKAVTFDASQFIKWLSLLVYCLNFIMVGADLLVYIRNYRIDKRVKK
jgi:uncharacterized membrane protein